MSFLIFLLVTATLFIRPAEVILPLEGVPIYEGLILTCLLCTLLKQGLNVVPGGLRSQPVTVCVLTLLPAIALSHLAHSYFGGALEGCTIFVKICIFYLLLISALDTPARLLRFRFWLVLFILIPTCLAMLRYYGYEVVPKITPLEQGDYDPATGEIVISKRLRAAGILSDPNDLCNNLVMGLILTLSLLNDRRSGFTRYVWLVPLAAFGYAVILTKSRGGFLALLAGLGTLYGTRLGVRKTLLLALVASPLLTLVSGRQADLSTSGGTSQERIQLWSDAMEAFKEAPIFGIGMNNFHDRAGLVSHNSFIHSLAELGIIGATCFCGAFFCLIYGCWRLGRTEAQIADPDLRYLRPYILAVGASFAVGLLSLTRVYDVLTYLLLGLGASFLRLAAISGPFPGLRFDRQLFLRITAISGASVVCFYLFVRLFVNRGGG